MAQRLAKLLRNVGLQKVPDFRRKTRRLFLVNARLKIVFPFEEVQKSSRTKYEFRMNTLNVSWKELEEQLVEVSRASGDSLRVWVNVFRHGKEYKGFHVAESALHNG